MPPAAFPNPPTELSNVLRNLGYPATIVSYIHTAEGLTTLQHVRLLDKDLIEPMFKAMRERVPPIAYTTLQVSMFKTLYSYLRRMQESRTPVIAATITDELLEQEADNVDYSSKRESDKKIPFPSEGFKKDTEWLSFRNKFRNYLNSAASSRKAVPLSYVVRPEAIPEGANPIDPIWTAPLGGDAFTTDNRLVYTYLVSLCQDGPGKTIVNRPAFANTSNGRAAFKLLDSTFTGGNYQTLL